MRTTGSPPGRRGGTSRVEKNPAAVTGVAACPEIAMARPKRSPNSHQIRVRELPFAARMRRDEPFRSADDAEWQAKADSIAGLKSWYVSGEWRDDADWKLIRFATKAEADEMQEWIAASGIETRPAPPRYDGPQLTVAGVKPS
jgi:hypothetical protein